MGLLDNFDLDFVMTSELEWGCYATLPALLFLNSPRALNRLPCSSRTGFGTDANFFRIMMEMATDVARLRALFEEPGLRWIMARLAERMARGRPLSGLIANAQATTDERRALDDLLGRRSTAGSRLSLDLATLEETLRAAGMAACLVDAVTACRGPIENQRERAERLRDEWETMLNVARSHCADQPALVGWVDALARDGT